MPVNSVLFDWDGTLMDSGPASLRAFQKMFREYGIDCTRERHDEIYTPDWYVMYRAFDLPRPLWEEADRRWLHHFAGEQPELIEGAMGTIEWLLSRGYRMGIVSGGTRHRILGELERLDLMKAFPVLVANEDVVQRKPHPEGLERAMKLLGCDRTTCYFVGDTPADMEMGRAAGVRTVGVTSGYMPHDRMALCGADVLLESIRYLPGVLG